jgi:hypothetical protein
MLFRIRPSVSHVLYSLAGATIIYLRDKPGDRLGSLPVPSCPYHNLGF